MNIVITSGGTSETIDSVRKITNMSTGKLGSTIATNLIKENHNIKIFFISNKEMILPFKNDNIKFIYTDNTKSVLKAIKKVIKENKIDFFIHSMAISDYEVDKVYNKDILKRVMEKELEKSNKTINNTEKFIDSIMKNLYSLDQSSKISSNDENLNIQLKKTPKIVDLIKKMDYNIKLISFKLLNNVKKEELIEIAKKQMIRTSSSLVIANDLSEINEKNHNAYFINNSNNNIIKVSKKEEIAKNINLFIKEENYQSYYSKKEIIENEFKNKNNNNKIIFDNLICPNCSSPIYTIDKIWFKCTSCKKNDISYEWTKIRNPLKLKDAKNSI